MKKNHIPLKSDGPKADNTVMGDRMFTASRVMPRRDHRYTDEEIKIMEEEIELMTEDWYKEYMARINQQPSQAELTKKHAEKMKAEGYLEHTTKSGKTWYVHPDFKNLSTEEISELEANDEKIDQLLGVKPVEGQKQAKNESRDFSLEELKKLRRAYIDGLKKIKTHPWFVQEPAKPAKKK